MSYNFWGHISWLYSDSLVYADLIEDAEGQLRLLFKRNTFAIRRTRFDMTSSSDLRSECITLASEVIDASNALAEQGKLRHLQDVGSVILSEIGLFFYKVSDECSKIQ